MKNWRPETGYVYDVRPVGMSGEGRSGHSVRGDPCHGRSRFSVRLEGLAGWGEGLLSWAETDEASTYVVYRAEGNGTGFERVSETEATEYVDVGLQVGNTYIYKVSAKNTVGEGECTKRSLLLVGRSV